MNRKIADLTHDHRHNQIVPSQLQRAMVQRSIWRIDAVLEQGELPPVALARADMYRRLGRTTEAPSSYEKALTLTQQEAERQFLQERIRRLK
jgi:predicted RNA polymerase sigma factor